MKQKSFISIMAIAFFIFVSSFQSVEAQDGSVHTEKVTYKPSGNGYEVEITFKYQFIWCYGEIKCVVSLENEEALAYHYDGRRLTENDLKEFGGFTSPKKARSREIDISAKLMQGSSSCTASCSGSSSVTLTNLIYAWGGCLGDTHDFFCSKEKEDRLKTRLNELHLKEIHISKAGYVDHTLESKLKKKKEEETAAATAKKKKEEENQEAYESALEQANKNSKAADENLRKAEKELESAVSSEEKRIAKENLDKAKKEQEKTAKIQEELSAGEYRQDRDYADYLEELEEIRKSQQAKSKTSSIDYYCYEILYKFEQQGWLYDHEWKNYNWCAQQGGRKSITPEKWQIRFTTKENEREYNAQQTQKYAEQAVSVIGTIISSSDNSRYKKYGAFIWGYDGDMQSLFGTTMGKVNGKGLGFYGTARLNMHIFDNIYAEVEDGVIKPNSKRFYDGTPYFTTDEIRDANAHLVFGTNYRLFYLFWIYAGAGVSYFYQTREFNSWVPETSTHYGGKEFVLDVDARLSDTVKWDPIFDAGLIFCFKGFYIKGGIRSDFSFDRHFFSFGIGGAIQ